MEIFQRLNNMIEGAMGKLVVGYIRIVSRQLNDLGVLKSLAEDERKHGRLNYACLDNPNSHSY